MQTIINKTPHPVNIVDEKGNVTHTFPKATDLIRLESKTKSAGTLSQGVPLTKTVFGKAEGLLDEKDGVVYIVSQLVKSALPKRKDLLVPAEVVRDNSGNIVGCRSLGI